MTRFVARDKRRYRRTARLRPCCFLLALLLELIGEIKAGTAPEERVKFGPHLDRNFISGEATITWNKADAERLKAE